MNAWDRGVDVCGVHPIEFPLPDSRVQRADLRTLLFLLRACSICCVSGELAQGNASTEHIPYTQ